MRVGLRLLEAAKDNFSKSPRVKQRGGIRIDRETRVGGAERLARAARNGQIKAFCIIRPHVIGSQRDRPVGRIDDFCIEIRFGARLRERKQGHMSESFARERVGVVRVGLERLVEQG